MQRYIEVDNWQQSLSHTVHVRPLDWLYQDLKSFVAQWQYPCQWIISLRKSKIGFLNPKTDFVFFYWTDQSKISWINWCVKGTEESTYRVDFLVLLTHHDPKDLGLTCLVTTKTKTNLNQFLDSFRFNSNLGFSWRNAPQENSLPAKIFIEPVTIFHERPGTKFFVPNLLQCLKFLGYRALHSQDGSSQVHGKRTHLTSAQSKILFQLLNYSL